MLRLFFSRNIKNTLQNSFSSSFGCAFVALCPKRRSTQQESHEDDGAGAGGGRGHSRARRGGGAQGHRAPLRAQAHRDGRGDSQGRQTGVRCRQAILVTLSL